MKFTVGFELVDDSGDQRFFAMTVTNRAGRKWKKTYLEVEDNMGESAMVLEEYLNTDPNPKLNPDYWVETDKPGT